jgi:hypothetical protein
LETEDARSAGSRVVGTPKTGNSGGTMKQLIQV